MSSDQPLGQPLGVWGKLALVFGGILPGIATGTISVMLPGISDAFDGAHHGLLVKMVATAAGLGMMIGAPVGGIVADRIGRRAVLMASVLLFAGFGLSALLVTNIWQLIGARLFIGFASGAMTACYVAIIGDKFEGSAQGKWLGINAAAAVLFVVLLNPVAGALVDTGWRHGFLVYAAALPMILLVAFGIPGGVAKAPTTAVAAPAQAQRFVRLPWQAIALVIAAGTLATGTVLYWPFRLRELGVTSARDMSLYYLPNIIVVCLFAFAYGYLRRWLSIAQVFALAGTASAVGLIVMAIAPSPFIMMIGLTIEGIAIGVMTPNLSMYAIELAPLQARAQVIGVMKGIYYGSPFLTQFALEALNRQAGVSAALLGVAAMGLGITFFMISQALKDRSSRSSGAIAS